MEAMEQKTNERTCGSDELAFRLYMQRNGQVSREMIVSIKDIISKNHLSAREARGFMEYMKLVIDSSSYIQD